MAISKDASTPVAVSKLGSTSATAVTAGFSPPAGSLVVIAVGIGYSTNTTTGPTVTVKDSLANAYAAGPAAYDGNFDGSYLFTHYYASAPGSVTVTATRAVALGASLFEVLTWVLDGAASSQGGAGSNSTHATTQVTAIEGSITTTQGGSWTVVTAAVGNQVSTFTAVACSNDYTEDDTTDSASGVGGHAVTGTPGTVAAMGWTVATASFFAWAALEILPAAGVAAVKPCLFNRQAIVTAATR